MAEGTSHNIKPEESDKSTDLECPVCLQKCVHPAQLPCGHVFCFLCVKGIANRSKRCALCRQEIPTDFIEQPKLLSQPDTKELFDGGYQWFYEGRNGWWQYDERTSRELETCYKNGERTCELLIAGFLYIADMDTMIQMRRNDHSRSRRIKRDLASVPKKGVAGLRTPDADQLNPQQDHVEYQNLRTPTDDAIPVTPTNTPQTPASGSESPHYEDFEITIERIRTLWLDRAETALENQDSNINNQ